MTDSQATNAMTDDEIVKVARLLVGRYTAEDVPPCRICGGPLSIQAIGGGGPTIYACSGQYEDAEHGRKYREGRSVADEHYNASQWRMYRHGDQDVLRVLAQLLSDRGLNMPDVRGEQ